MEFASEMVVKAAMRGLRTAEVPIVLHPTGAAGRRISGPGATAGGI
jgi:hypothetical protein